MRPSSRVMAVFGGIAVAGGLTAIFTPDPVMKTVKTLCGLTDPKDYEIYVAADAIIQKRISYLIGDGWDEDIAVDTYERNLVPLRAWAEALPDPEMRDVYLKVIAADQAKVDEDRRVGAEKKAARADQHKRIVELADCMPEPP